MAKWAVSFGGRMGCWYVETDGWGERRTLGDGSRMRKRLTPTPEEEEEREMAPEVKRPNEESTARDRGGTGGG